MGYKIYGIFCKFKDLGLSIRFFDFGLRFEVGVFGD